MKARSVYLHFPFCETKCHYCDFYSLGREKTAAKDPFLFAQALETEINLRKDELDSEIDTIFMGGGTPSMTDPGPMRNMIAPLLDSVRFSQDLEWTIEGNPSSLSYTHLKEYQALGVNRLSMGVQALNDDLLAQLGRVHSASEALRALDAAFSSGLKNVSVDLLCGVPDQTLGHLEHALNTFIQFPITHLSCYILTLPPHHRMYSRLPNEDTQLQHYLFVHDWMSSHGFDHYEISNFALPGFKAKHNLIYWEGKGYAGFGPSAHSFDETKRIRFKNVSSLHKYAALLKNKEKPHDFSEQLTGEQIELERWLLGTRLSDGFPRQWLSTPTQQAKALALQDQGLIESHPIDASRIRLTPKGFALSDSIIQSLAG